MSRRLWRPSRRCAQLPDLGAAVLVIECVPAVDGVPVDPCGTVGTQALVPVVRSINPLPPLDYSGIGQLFSWAVGFVLIVFVVGVGVGAIVRVIRSA